MQAADKTVSLPLNAYLLACRRALHQIPELRFDLPQTTEFVTEQLRAMDIPYRVVENGGVIALIGDPDRGDTFLLREDMDALPLQELSGLPFASQNGNMHACGHDLHTAMLLGAAKLLKEREQSLRGAVKLAFQSNEEGIKGMLVLIENGVMEAPHVDASLSLHVFPGSSMPAGTYSSMPGAANSSVNEYRIEIHGKGAHGSTPYKGIDPINVGVQIYNALLTMVAKEVDGRETVVLSNGYFHGGTQAAYNIIPDNMVMGGGIRTFSNEVADQVKKRLKEVAEATAAAFRAGCTVTFPSSAPACINAPEICDLVERCAADLGMENLRQPPQLCSDDYSHVGARVPSGYIWLGAGGTEPEYADGVLHDPRVCFNEDALVYGAELMAAVAEGWLAEHAPAESL